MLTDITSYYLETEEDQRRAEEFADLRVDISGDSASGFGIHH